MYKLMSQFKVVGDTMNLTKASEILGISQPTLTQNLSRLEKKLNAQLFNRKSHGITLTEQGELLYNNACLMVNVYENTLEQFGNEHWKPTRIIQIGCGFNWTHTELIEPIKAVTSQYPQYAFEFTNGESVALQQKLLNRDYDIVMGTIPYTLLQNDDLAYEPIFESKFVIYADKNHPLNKLVHIEEKDLLNQKWVNLRHIEELNIKDGRYDYFVSESHVKYVTKSVTTAVNLVTNSEYLIFLPLQFQLLAKTKGLVPLPTVNSTPEFTSGMMYLKENRLAQEIVEKMKNLYLL